MTTIKAINMLVFRRRMQWEGGRAQQSTVCVRVTWGRQGDWEAGVLLFLCAPQSRPCTNGEAPAWMTYQSLLLSFREHRVPQHSRDPEEPAVISAHSGSSFGSTGNSTPQSRGNRCSRRDPHRDWGCGKVPVSVANNTCAGAGMDYH